MGTDSPSKLGALRDKPQGFYCVKNKTHCRWIEYVSGFIGSEPPRGEAFVAAVKDLADRAGVDSSRLGAGIDPAERERRAGWMGSRDRHR